MALFAIKELQLIIELSAILKLDYLKSEVSRLALSNNRCEILAVVFTANFTSVITEELTHAARQLKKRSGAFSSE